MSDDDTRPRRWTQDLPKAPLPDLEKTLERYLACLKPVIPVAQYEQTRKTVSEFLESGGEGETLQEALRQFAEERENWFVVVQPLTLDKLYLIREVRHVMHELLQVANRIRTLLLTKVTELWMDDMYLCNPLPLPINSNPFYLLPKQNFRSTSDQIRYATKIIQFCFEFKKRIDSQALPQDFGSGHGKGAPLCMDTYKNFFASCRIPGEKKDRLTVSKDNVDHFIVATKNQNSRHATSIFANQSCIFLQFFAVRLTPSDASREETIMERLRFVVHLAKESEFNVAPVGLLTTENRRVWGAIHANMSKSPVNQESLQLLEESLFVVCLDDSVSVKAAAARTQRRDSIQMARMDPSYMASQLLAGGGSEFFTPNRWFDKFLQFVVAKDGIVGIVCEHTGSEGITVLRFLEEFLEFVEKTSAKDGLGLARTDSVKNFAAARSTNEALLSSQQIRRLQWDLDEPTLRALQEAGKRINKLIEDLDLYVLHFGEFGKNFIKQQKMSPDAFIQLALQLTYYKVHRKLVSTYESAGLRQYRLGRVDNIRAATFEALAWVKAMCDEIPEITERHKEELFHKALAKQIEVLKYTIAGHGPDNHLLGLREMSRRGAPEGSEPCALFREKAYKEYLNFRLSTSQLPTEKGILVGYGAVVEDGYGCSYNPRSESITFCIGSFYSAAESSSDFFARSLEGSLLQMRELCLKPTTA